MAGDRFASADPPRRVPAAGPPDVGKALYSQQNQNRGDPESRCEKLATNFARAFRSPGREARIPSPQLCLRLKELIQRRNLCAPKAPRLRMAAIQAIARVKPKSASGKTHRPASRNRHK